VFHHSIKAAGYGCGMPHVDLTCCCSTAVVLIGQQWAMLSMNCMSLCHTVGWRLSVCIALWQAAWHVF
jgi:hypothetical protein